MREAYYPGVDELLARQRLRRIGSTALLCAITVLVFTTVGLCLYFTQMPLFAAFAVGLCLMVCIVIPVVIWRNPKLGFYGVLLSVFLFGGASGLSHATMPTGVVQLWRNVSSIGQYYGSHALNGLAFSPAELILFFTLTAWTVRTISLRRFRFEWGAFVWPIGIYSCFVLFGWFHGLTSGGDATMALYEVRAQAHFVFAYILAVNLIREDKDIKPIFWGITFCSGLQGIFGMITYFSLPNVTEEGFMDHAESLFFNFLFLLVIIVPLVGADRRLAWALVFAAPAPLIAALGNQRRASIAAFIIAFIPLLPLMWVLLKERRAMIGKFAVAFLCINAVYLPVAWNGHGAWALPARAIRSNSDPSGRDAGSDYYRMAEDINLKYTRDLNPWFGVGYGKPFAQIVALPSVSTDFLQYMPHDSVLWVWMRLGHFGFLAFLMMIATVLIRGPQILKTVKSPFRIAAGVVGFSSILMLFTFGKYDLALASPPVMFMTGAFVGMLGGLQRRPKPTISAAKEEELAADSDDDAGPAPAGADGL